MKRLHIHIHTADLDQSIRYYTALFGVEPTKREADYAKWMLDEPAANIAISSRGGAPGVDHLGISLDDDGMLEEIADRMKEAQAPLEPEKNATCCYARANKYWSRDPQGATWELFHTFADADHFGKDAPQLAGSACCTA